MYCMYENSLLYENYQFIRDIRLYDLESEAYIYL